MRKVLLLFLFVNSFYSSFSQYDEKNTVAVPSPNNLSSAISNIGASLYTGTPEINIPIYGLTSKELTVPTSLSYTNANGIKVQDIANFTGLGWRLNAGGNVSRIVRGLPDETKNGYIGINHAGQSIATGVTNDLVSKIGYGQSDGEPDLFIVTTPFFSSKFVLDEYGVPVFANNSGLKISHNLYSNIDTVNTSWVITDDNGNQYFFGTTASSREKVSTKLFDNITTYTSTWYLEKIITYNSKDIINFYYQSGPDYSINYYDVNQTVLNTTGPCSVVGSNVLTSNLTTSNTFISPKYISTITTSIGELDFNYQFDRRDITNAARLSSIVVYPFDPAIFIKANAIKKYEFNYSYFNSASSNQELLRLKLDYIDLYGADSAIAPIKYKIFSYNTSANLPERNSVEFDYWGYYNINTSGTTLVPAANKEPDFNRTMANVLTSIQDETGAITKLQYELNTYYDLSSLSNVQIGGLRIKRLSKGSTVTGYIYTDYIYESDGKSTGQIYSQNYKRFTKNIYVALINGSGQICIITGANTLSRSVYNAFDLNGNFVGYSTVKQLHQNGGYEIDNFTNFSDFPDVFNYSNTNNQVYGYSDARQLSAATSFSYKRGLLKNKAQYNADGTKVNETLYSYNSLDVVAGKAMSIKATPLSFVLGANVGIWIYGTYRSNVENYVLIKTTERLYDQKDQTLYQEQVSNYSYSANKRQIRTVTRNNSKGSMITLTSYYPGDLDIPDLTTEEQQTISSMVQGNRTNVVVHSRESINNVTNDIHSSYNKILLPDNILRPVLVSTTSYRNNDQTDSKVKKQLYQYDVNSLNMSNIRSQYGIAQSTLYGYNNTLVKAEVTNASNSSIISTYQSTEFGVLEYSPNNGSQSILFNVDYAGNVDLSIDFLSSGSGEIVSTVTYQLVGKASGKLCTTNIVPGTCLGSSSVTLQNITPGTYTLIITPTAINNSAGTDFFVTYSYPKLRTMLTPSSEFFYEGFEEDYTAATTNSYAGFRYHSGSYTVPFTPVLDRQYRIDYHYLLNNVWFAASKDYQVNMVLNDGIAIDEVRVYPKDALMKTYTHNPLIGVTSICDGNNRFNFYEYDNFGRLATIRDNDKNIIKKFYYQYLSGLYYNTAQGSLFTRNNCDPGFGAEPINYSVNAGVYSSDVSQADANQKAMQDVNLHGQVYANQVGICKPIYYSTQQSGSFTRTCAPGFFALPVIFTVNASMFTSFISQADADQKALNYLNQQGPLYAERRGLCRPYFYNVEKSAVFIRNNCGSGYEASSVTYTVLAGSYAAASQAEADQLAQNDLDINGQNYANANGTCTVICTNCNNPSRKCVNGVCIRGFIVYTLCLELEPNEFHRVYHYEYSDGSWSPDFLEISNTPCY